MKKIFLMITALTLALSLISCKKEQNPDRTAEIAAQVADELETKLREEGFAKTVYENNKYFITYISYLDKEGEIFNEEERKAGYGYLYTKENEDSITVLVFDSISSAKRYRDNYIKSYKSSPYAIVREGAVVVVGNKEVVSELEF